MNFPSSAPTEAYNLPPQAAPSISFVPTLNGGTTDNPAIHFRITALAILFSISGVIFILILVYQSVMFLIEKRWDEDDVSKWELDRQNDEKRRLLEEIEIGVRKPDKGVQFDESDVNDEQAKRLDPSWIREKDFAMQWEDPTLLETQASVQCKILIANSNRWKEKSGESAIPTGASTSLPPMPSSSRAPS
jgi:hypothetical protein